MSFAKKKCTVFIMTILSVSVIDTALMYAKPARMIETLSILIDQLCVDIKEINKQLLLLDERSENYDTFDDVLVEIYDDTIATLKQGYILISLSKKYQLYDQEQGKIQEYLEKQIFSLQKNAIRVFTKTNVFPGVLHDDASGIVFSNLIVDADIDSAASISDSKLNTISTAGKVANSATTATSSNVINTIVERDASGNFSAGTITANVSGNATTSTTATSFSGTLTGDVTGTQSATVVSSVGGQTSSNIASSVTTVVAATNANTASTLVKRDGTGSFSAQTISLVDEVASGNINLSNSTSSSVGNIVKNGTSFIHNYGTSNTFVGESAGNFTMSGSGHNVGIGKSSLVANTTGSSNVAVGFSAGVGVTSGSNNVMIGDSVAASTTTGSNNIYIDGSGLNPANESNTIRIGGTQTTCFMKGINGVAITGTGVLVSSSGQLGTLISSRKFKNNIYSMNNESDKIYALNPVLFTYKSDENNLQQYGLIAEEVDQIIPDIVIKDENGDPYTIRYEILPIFLLNELQKNKIIVDDLLLQIAQLKREMTTLAAEVIVLRRNA